MKADEYTPLEHNIWKLYRSSKGRHSFNIFRSIHQSLTLTLQQSICMVCVLVNHHHSNIHMLTELVVYLQVKGFLFSIDFWRFPIKRFKDDGQKQQLQILLNILFFNHIVQNTILKLQKNCKTVTLIYLTIKNYSNRAELDREEGGGLI